MKIKSRGYAKKPQRHLAPSGLSETTLRPASPTHSTPSPRPPNTTSLPTRGSGWHWALPQARTGEGAGLRSVWSGQPPAPAPGCPSLPVAAFVDGPPLDCRCSVQGRAADASSHTHSRRGPTSRGTPAHADGGGGGNGAPFGVPALQARGDLGEGGAESEGQALDIHPADGGTGAV